MSASSKPSEKRLVWISYKFKSIFSSMWISQLLLKTFKTRLAHGWLELEVLRKKTDYHIFSIGLSPDINFDFIALCFFMS